MKTLSAFALLLLTALSSARAQTTIHLYRGGEDDAGAANGVTLGTSAVDAAGSKNLSFAGSGGTYTNDTSDAGSALAYSFSGGSFTASADTTLTTTSSFAMEVWFNAASLPAGYHTLFYNGNNSASGLGLILIGSDITIVRGGAAVYTLGTATTSTWIYAGLVFDNGVLTGYVNGSATSIGAVTFANPTGSDSLTLARSPTGADPFSGSLDNARIFTFPTGTFDASMLGFSAIPEPSTYAAILGLGALAASAWRRRRRTA